MKKLCDVSPCLTCHSVKNPELCENKNCRLWRRWFLDSWDKLRELPCLQHELKQTHISTVNIGGTQYAHPDRIREYLESDPCCKCKFPRELCTSPCPAKRTWMDVNKEVCHNELEK